MRPMFAAAALVCCACGPSAPAEVPIYSYQVVHQYPHDPKAFTQGLVYLDGFLYEGTGLEFQSSIRKVRLERREVLQKYDVPQQYFGEGIVIWKDRIVELTYTTQVGFVYDLATFKLQKQFSYKGEGWGLTHDGKRIIMSDGTDQLRFWDPETLQETGRISVTDDGRAVRELNELEWIKGEVWANVWRTEKIARIDPSTGKVVGWIDLTGLLEPAERKASDPDVLNGIAYDAAGDRLFVTGKKWPKLFEIKLVKKK